MLVVFVASLKFFFVEGGEQFVVGAQKAKKIGIRSTPKITIAGISFAIVLFFLLYYSHVLIQNRWLELARAITLYFFAATIFKEAFENESDETEDENPTNTGYIYYFKFGVYRKCNCFGRIDFY
jgi:hypothetical protein